MQIEQNITVEGGRRACEQDQEKGGRRRIGVRLPPREQKSSTKRRRYRLRGLIQEEVGRKNNMGKGHMVGEIW